MVSGGNPDSNTLISDMTTVICLDDYHSLDRFGRKEKVRPLAEALRQSMRCTNGTPIVPNKAFRVWSYALLG